MIFVTAVCVLYLVKLRWPKKNSIYNIIWLGFDERDQFFLIDSQAFEFDIWIYKIEEFLIYLLLIDRWLLNTLFLS